MNIDQLLLFVSLTGVVSASPGPVMLNCMAIGSRQGSAAVAPAMVGASLGNLALMVLSALGLTWVVGRFPTIFQWIQWGGAAYLIWLGINALKAPLEQTDLGQNAQSQSHFRDAFIIAVSNPKGLLYFGALLPQFVHYDQPLAVQFALLSAIFLSIDLVWMWLYAFAGERIMALIRTPSHRQWFNRLTASLLILAGVLVGWAGTLR